MEILAKTNKQIDFLRIEEGSVVIIRDCVVKDDEFYAIAEHENKLKPIRMNDLDLIKNELSEEEYPTHNFYHMTVNEILKNKSKCPFPINVIPNQMGINLNSIDNVKWVTQNDGQLCSVVINFLPEKNYN